MKAFLVIVTALIWGCKPVDLINMQGYILGPKNDIKPLTQESASDIPDEVIAASVLIATEVEKGRMKFCSGSLVAPAEGESLMRILTNHHCFANVDEKGRIDANWIPVACLKTTVYFGFSIESEQKDLTTIACKENSLRSDLDGDVAIFTLAENPSQKYRPLKIKSKTADVDKKAYILHYPDVASNYRVVPGTKIRLPAASITNDDCVSKGLFSEREWQLDRSLPYSFKHTCDLVQGSSGSALIDAESHEIMGVNWGGIKINYNEVSQTHNVATGPEFIQAFLSGQHEDLKLVTYERQQSSASAVAAKAKAESGDQKKSTFLEKAQSAACGQIGLGLAKTWESFFVLILLLGPVVFRKTYVS